MIPRKLAFIQRNKAQDSSKSENSRKKHRERKRRHRKRKSRAQQASRQNDLRTLQSRYEELQRQEDDLLLRIGQAKKPGPAYWSGKNNQTLRHYPNPQASELSLLQSHLKDVRHEKDQVRKQLEKAQR